MVFFRSGTGLTVADGQGAVLSSHATVANADWSRLYAVRGGELVTSTPSSRVLATAAVPPGLVARVVSADGRFVALAGEGATYAPVPRQRTRIVVADPSGERPVRALRLAGNFEPEAFSSDGTHLFVLEYLPAAAPERYRVRRVEIASGTVVPLLLRDRSLVPPGAEEEMRGEGRQAVLAPDRSRLYTLYLHRGEHEYTRDLISGADVPQVHAFVHVLSLTEGWAYCLDLPSPFGEQPAGTHALAVSPNGTRLFIGELTTGQVAVADTTELRITRVRRLAGGSPATDGTSMTVSPDGRSVYAGSGTTLHRLDARTLAQADVWRAPARIQGVAVAPDGGQVLLGQPDGIARLDTSSGEVVGTFAADGLRTLYLTR